MRLILIFLLLLSRFSSSGQVTVKKHTKNTLPSILKYNGTMKNAVSWKDTNGYHYVITSETGIQPSKSGPEGGRDAELFAYHYLQQGDSLRLTWKVYDFTKDCPVDLRAHFMNNTFSVTDLDKDGIAEIWMMYRTVCHGDVSPSNMKIIMYENDKKHAVRGTNKVKVSEKDYEGGEYEFDVAFKEAPEVIKAYARGLWNKNLLEKWD
jgi:hypothetical protein